MGAEQNHLSPVNTCSPGLPVRTAFMVFVRTSEPPWRSVIAMPTRTPFFCFAGRRPGSYSSVSISGSHSRASAGAWRSAGTAA